MIRVTSLGTAVPDRYVLTQDQALEMLGYTAPLSRRIFHNAGIQKRHLWVNPVGLPPDELRAEYEKGMVELGCQAVGRCLDGRPLSDIGCLVFASCTNPHPMTPGPAHHIAAALGLPHRARLVNSMGGGCQGGLPSLDLAYLYAKEYRQPALALSVEICSTTYFPSPEGDHEGVVCAAIFGDGASCALVEPSDNPEYPAIIDFANAFDSRYLMVTGYKWVGGRVKVVLGKELPELVPPLMASVVLDLLNKHRLSLEDVGGWAVHNGGVNVLNKLAQHLGVDGRQLFRHSWDVLRDCGNMSSATVGMVAKRVHADPSNGRHYLVAASTGAGCEVSACLLRYG